jgi:hypothetical protein
MYRALPCLLYPRLQKQRHSSLRIFVPMQQEVASRRVYIAFPAPSVQLHFRELPLSSKGGHTNLDANRSSPAGE